MFRTAFKSVTRQSLIARSYSTVRTARSNTKVIVGASLAVSTLLLLPLSVVKNDIEPNTDNVKLVRKERGVDAKDQIASGKKKQPRKASDDKQPETKVIPVEQQSKKSQQPESSEGSIKKSVSEESEKSEKPNEATAAENLESNGEENKSEAKTTDGQADATEGEAEESSGEQSAAFNPETGEINWDCPCLGGMAHGPCGEEFKAAFSCFVYSETEPKGIDCIEKFEGMRSCFRQHPEHYKEELYEDDEPVPSTESNAAGDAAENGEEVIANLSETA